MSNLVLPPGSTPRQQLTPMAVGVIGLTPEFYLLTQILPAVIGGDNTNYDYEADTRLALKYVDEAMKQWKERQKEAQ